MDARISSTELARNLSDLLNRVRYRGESFVILRNGEEVGVLRPVTGRSGATLRELVRRIEEGGFPDDDFVADLEAVRRDQPRMPEEPWTSSSTPAS